MADGTSLLVEASLLCASAPHRGRDRSWRVFRRRFLCMRVETI
jgi:hypothetical protein